VVLPFIILFNPNKTFEIISLGIFLYFSKTETHPAMNLSLIFNFIVLSSTKHIFDINKDELINTSFCSCSSNLNKQEMTLDSNDFNNNRRFSEFEQNESRERSDCFISAGLKQIKNVKKNKKNKYDAIK
jgi:hypothetical protein